MIVMFIMSIPSYAQDCYKIKISKKKVKFILKDNLKEIFEIDSISSTASGPVYYLSSAEKKMIMEILEDEQLIRTVETFEGIPKKDSYDQLNLNAIAINRSAFKD
jgi:hypothetical protein